MAPQQERPAGPGVAGERGGAGGGDGGQTGANNKQTWFPAKLDINGNLIPGAFYRAAAAAPGGRAGEGGATTTTTAAAGAADRPRQDKLLQQVVLRADTAGARMLISRTQTGIQN